MIEKEKGKKQSAMQIYHAKDVIVWQDTLEKVFYKILKGKVGVYLNYQTEREVFIAEKISPSCFGEMALLNDEPRSATVVALEETLVLVVDETSFLPFLVNNPQNAYDIMKTLSLSLKNSTELIKQISAELQDKKQLSATDAMSLNSKIQNYYNTRLYTHKLAEDAGSK